jgi:hypothetical protein
MPVISAAHEAEIRRIKVQSQPEQIDPKKKSISFSSVRRNLLLNSRIKYVMLMCSVHLHFME